MHICSLRQALVENLIDLISIKSGLMISEFKAFDFLSEILPGWWQGDKKEIIRIEVGEFEDAFIHLMYKVGAIQNKEDLTDVVISYVKNNYQQLCLDPTNVMEVYKTVNDLKIHLLENTLQNKTFPEKFLQLPHLEILIRDFKDRYIMHNEMPDSVNWNGIIPLNTLFEEEIIPDGSSSNCYFDQRYIDYLNRQIEDIGKIHWRQFEYLTGEFFQRNGYVVEVTSGRGDGGIDVIAKKENPISGPEMILIQCKKYSDRNHVEVEAVRAFWATINDTGATKGIIATTSRLTSGAKDYCQAKLYRLDSVEHSKIKDWIESMKS
ncbi:restriction endonuclease [Aliarcobacter cryaerophilus]|uniref:restriction endonuclease n=1 Tax=Aliarcobacter cryaerophilus TaxID=28198 RepID=UPI003DA53DFD